MTGEKYASEGIVLRGGAPWVAQAGARSRNWR